MHIWRKRADPEWVHSHVTNLTRTFGRSLAIIENARNKQAVLEIYCVRERAARDLVREFGGSVHKLRSDWLRYFAQQARHVPLRVGARLRVLDRRESRGSETRSIIIPAEAAFGTGQHATTAMSLRLLERITRTMPSGWRMLDAGTGSGILAIAGHCFGASDVLAIDNDPLACATAKRNARRNRVGPIEFVVGDILQTKLHGNFDVITANLFSGILMATLPMWSRHLAPRGSIIISGILRTQENLIKRALKKSALDVVEIRRRGKWIALLAKN